MSGTPHGSVSTPFKQEPVSHIDLADRLLYAAVKGKDVQQIVDLAAEALSTICGKVRLSISIAGDEMDQQYRSQPFPGLSDKSGARYDATVETENGCSAHIRILSSAEFVVPRELLAGFLQIVSARAMDLQQAKLASDAHAVAVRRLDEVANLFAVDDPVDLAAQNPGTLYQQTIERAANALSADAGAIMWLDEATVVLRPGVTWGLPRLIVPMQAPLGRGIAGKAAILGEPINASPGQTNSRLDQADFHGVEGPCLAIPLKHQDRTLLGAMVLCRSTRKPAFDSQEVQLAGMYAVRAAQIASSHRLYRDLRQKAVELGTLSTMSRALLATIEPSELLTRILAEVVEVVGIARCSIFLWESARQAFTGRAFHGYSEALQANLAVYHGGVIQHVVTNRETLHYDTVQDNYAGSTTDRFHAQCRGFARTLGVEAFVALPILNGQGECLGVFLADNRGKARTLSPDQSQLLSAFIGQAGIAIDNALLYVKGQADYHKIRRLTEYTENVLQAIPAGIISTSSDGRIQRWNAAAEKILCQPRQLLRGASLASALQRAGVPDGERLQVMSLFRQVLHTGSTVYQIRLSPTGNDSRPDPRTLSVNLSRLSSKTGQDGVVLRIEDITREVEMMEQFDHMRRLADIGQLAAKMAHEVRNALSPIRGAAQLVRSELLGKGESTEWPDIIMSEVDGLNSLTRTMLDFARPTKLSLREIELDTFLHTSINSLSTLLVESKVSVAWNLAKDIPNVVVDPVQLGLAVRNIVINAVQSMPDGGTLTVISEFIAERRVAEMHFRDTGTGIEPEHVERIFEPFVTSRPQGTGLGLAIVTKIASSHGGRVYVQNVEDQGAHFTLEIPVAPAVTVRNYNEPSPMIGERTGQFPDD